MTETRGVFGSRFTIRCFITVSLLLSFGLPAAANTSQATDPVAGNTCKANDLVLAASFEPASGYTLTFEETGSVVLTGLGDSAALSVRYEDPQGNEADPGNLEWCLADDRLLSLSPSGRHATISATGFEITSVDVLVRDPQTNATARGLVVLAALQPEFMAADAALWISGTLPDFDTPSIFRLRRTPFTESLTPGMILSNSELGLIGKIVSITPGADSIDFEVVLPTLIELFDEVNIQTVATGAPLEFELQDNGQAVVRKIGPGDDQAEVLGIADFSCEGGLITGSAIPDLTFTFNRTEFIWTLEKEAENDLEFEVFELGVRLSGKALVSLDNVEVAVAPNIKCSVTLGPEIPGPQIYPAGLLLPVGIGPSFQLAGGFSASLSSSAARLTLPSPRAEVIWQYEAGVGFSRTLGAYRLNERFIKWQEVPSPRPPPPRPDQFSIDVTPEIGLDVNLAVTAATTVLASAKILELRTTLPIRAQLADPINPLDRDYTGPSWSIRQKVKLDFASSFGDILQSIADNVLGVSLLIGDLKLGEPLFEVDLPWLENSAPSLAGSPPLILLTTDCNGPVCRLDPVVGDLLTHTTTLGTFPASDSASTRLLGWKDGAFEGVTLDTQPVEGSTASGPWLPRAEDEGTWTIGTRWSDTFDPLNLTNTYPYASNQVTGIVVGRDLPPFSILSGDYSGSYTGTGSYSLIGNSFCGTLGITQNGTANLVITGESARLTIEFSETGAQPCPYTVGPLFNGWDLSPGDDGSLVYKDDVPDPSGGRWEWRLVPNADCSELTGSYRVIPNAEVASGSVSGPVTLPGNGVCAGAP